jgi:hypothetical protein
MVLEHRRRSHHPLFHLQPHTVLGSVIYNVNQRRSKSESTLFNETISFTFFCHLAGSNATFYRPPAGWPTRADLVAYEWYRSPELVGIAVSSAAGVIGRYLRYVFLLVYDVQFELKTSGLNQN